jgi:NAD+ synthase
MSNKLIAERDPKKLLKDAVEWTRNYVDSFGGKTKVVIGISGGKDSSVSAAILVKAIGKDRVVGVMMPNGYQHDIDKSRELIAFLGIQSKLVDISPMTKAFEDSLGEPMTYCTKSNMPARVRMTVLYNVAAQIGDARVVNNCNYSEDFVGYSTKFGDAAGDFSILSNLTVRQVKSIGYELGLPTDLVEKKPEDGLSGKTDEDNLGFSYAQLDSYILDGKPLDAATEAKVLKLRKNNMHKLLPMPCFGE